MLVKNIIIHEFASRCFILTSFHRVRGGNDVEPQVSFLYRSEDGTAAAEWEVRHGPLQLWLAGSEPHYALSGGVDVDGSRGRWAQSLVDDYGLAHRVIDGSYETIFKALRSYLERATTNIEGVSGWTGSSG